MTVERVVLGTPKPSTYAESPPDERLAAATHPALHGRSGREKCSASDEVAFAA
jgi:hypothetical protein